MEYIYGALLLHKLKKPLNEENLKKVIAATGAHIDDASVKTLIASLKGVDIDAELQHASIALAAPPHGAVTHGAVESKKEEPAEEKLSESAAGLASLFG